ncbi:MAG: YdcF family protein [Candidatus Peribacteria bacterium]|nr:MAG: YdcF family protein [Candidatus Peribacteria bacterium]
MAVVNSLFIINIWIISFDDLLGYKDTVYPYGIILGASVSPDGDLSQALQDRVDAAIAAYNDGVIQKIFVSGDDQEYYKEVTTIATYLQEHAIDSKDVVLDPYGVDTYDSMRRASHLYGVAKALIFTQQYHLSRSVYLARKLGIHADGFPVDS